MGYMKELFITNSVCFFLFWDKQTPAALHYLFRMLDVQHAGYLTPETVQHFVQSMQEQMQEMHQKKEVNLEDVNKMIFSMVKPMDAGKITLQDLSKWYALTSSHFAIVI